MDMDGILWDRNRTGPLVAEWYSPQRAPCEPAEVLLDFRLLLAGARGKGKGQTDRLEERQCHERIGTVAGVFMYLGACESPGPLA